MRRLTYKQANPRCSQCPLGATNRCYIGTDVYTDSTPGTTPEVDVLFVTDYPTYEDDIQRLPMMGDGGRAVRTHIETTGGGVRYAFAHVVRCRAKGDDKKWRAPSPQEVDICGQHILDDIRTLKPRVVVLMGAITLMSVNPDPLDTTWASGAVMDARRGGPKVIDGITYVPMPSPNQMVSKPAQRGLILGDISRALVVARGTADQFSAKGRSVLIGTIPEFKEFKDHILHGLTSEDSVALDTETLNLNRIGENKVLTWQFAWDFDTGYVVPFDHGKSPWSPHELETIIKPGLREIFTAPASFQDWVTHSGTFEVDKAQRFLGIYRFQRPIFDTLFGAYTMDENRVLYDTGQKRGKGKGKGYGPLSLKTLAPEFLGFFHYSAEADALEARNAGLLGMLDFQKLVEYGGMDAYVTLRLRHRILEMAGKYAPALYRFTTKWFSRAIPMSPYIERNGIFVDRKQLKVLQSEDSPILKRTEEVRELLYALPETIAANAAIQKRDGRTAGMEALFGEAPRMFQINKKEHVVELFLNQLRLSPLELGKPTKNYPDGEPSIDAAFYKEYGAQVVPPPYPAVAYISEFKGLEKLRTSYLNSIQNFLDQHPDMQDNRVRASLLWTRTVTNRVSQKDPNNSQLPRADNPYKRSIKALYRAPPGFCLMEADYSQAEIRWWAQLADDREYAKMFSIMNEMRLELAANPHNEELKKRVELECDVHKMSAAIMYRKPIAEITKGERQEVKSLVFGAIYGQHINTLAQILKISPDEAQSLQDRFFGKVRHAAQWLQDIEQFALRHGYVADAFKRRRHLRQELDSADKGVASRALRQARNSPVQGSSSNMMVLAACNIHDQIIEEKRPVKLLNLVHDAMLVEVPLRLSAIQSTATLMETEMIRADHLKEDWKIDLILPFEVEFKVGISWGHAKTVKAGDTWDYAYKGLLEAAKADGQDVEQYEV